MLLDAPAPDYWHPAVKGIWSARHGATRFLVDPETWEHAYELWRDNEALVEDMEQFAKPPFEKCYFEADVTASSVINANDLGESIIVGALLMDGILYSVTNGESDARPVVLSPYAVDIRSFRKMLRIKEILPGVSEKDAQMFRENAVATHGLLRVLWLLMLAPKGVVIGDQGATSKIVKGKRRAYAAHKTVTINLSPKESIERIRAGGGHPHSGAYPVQGTWVHYYRVRSCSHDWKKVLTEDGRPERYLCDCGTMRVWRKDHTRGDASRGFTTHDYHITNEER